MNISSLTRDEHVRVRVSGRVDAVESPALGAALATHIDAGSAHVKVDLSDVDYLDSSGLAVLVRSWRVQSVSGRRLTIVLPKAESARRIFNLTGFDAVFDIDDSDVIDQH